MPAKAARWVDGDTGEWKRSAKYPQGCKARRASRLRNRASSMFLAYSRDRYRLLCFARRGAQLDPVPTACVPLAGRLDRIPAISGC